MGQIDIGVTVGRASDELAPLLWASGINQNAVLLSLLLARLPSTRRLALIDCSGKPGPHPLATWAGLPTITPDEAASLDLVIEIGARAPAETMWRLKERRGRLVSYLAGNAMALNFEAVSSGLPHGEIRSDVPFDAVWILPHHWHMNRDLCRITRSPNVAIAPYLWDPMFVDGHARGAGLDPFFRAGDDKPWRVAVLEPNINVLKTFHLPLLVCEEAFRAAPALIDRVLLFNTSHLVGVPHFDDLTTSLDLFKAGRLFAEGRFPTPQILGGLADAVVVHQWENGLNNLYWDVLWTGHPLIHNAPAAAEVGYHYASFDPADGGRVLADALGRHRGRAAQAREEALAFLRRFSIDEPGVIAAHRDLIEGVLS